MTTYKCSLCDLISLKGNIKRHITKIHNGSGTIIDIPGTVNCEKCNKEFTSDANLKHHLKSCGMSKIPKEPIMSIILDKYNIQIRYCENCNKSSNQTDFYMNNTKTKYENPRCTDCQAIYRASLYNKGACYIESNYLEYIDDLVSCRVCKKTTDDDIIFSCETMNNYVKFYYTCCRDCREKEIINERICHGCKKSSYDILFETYSINEIEYYYKYCFDCREHCNYINYIKENRVPEKLCKNCNCSSLTNIFNYISYTNITLDIYCIKCADPTIYTNYSNSSYNNKLSRLNTYIKSALKCNREWTLTNEEVIIMFSNPCDYCGMGNNNGIDRIDNNIGYIKSNCVSCCKACNFAKGRLSRYTFINMCINVSKHQLSHNNISLT